MSNSIEDNILKAKQAAAEDMYVALQSVALQLAAARKLNVTDAYAQLRIMAETVNPTLDVATYAVRPICPNCDTELPEGCGGIFKEADDGHCLWVETKKEPA